jgi:CDP-diglyceride synthetase
MLKTRIITAVVLLAVLLPVLFFNYFPAFALVVTLFVGAAVWGRAPVRPGEARPAWPASSAACCSSA